MAINIDADDTNADWMRTRTWDLPRTAKALILNIGADRWEHFKTLPAFKAIPAGLEHDVDQYLSVQHLGVVKSQSDDGKVNDPVAKRTGTAHYSQGRILPLKKYSEDQERDASGRFGSGGSTSNNSQNQKLGIGQNGSATAHNAKEAYRQKFGVPDPVGEINYRDLVCDKERAKEISDAYDKLPLDDPAAHAAYDQLAQEIAQQYDFLTNDLGIKVSFVDHDPYPTAREMFQDVEGNKSLQVLSTAATGSHSYFSDETNDMFRAVHDYFGHAATGRGFMQDGEEAAWVSHSTMFSPEASSALTSETRGQNSWVNNHDSGFADQKTALLPEKFWYAADAGYKFAKASYKSAKALLASLRKYNDSQERDSHGRFGSGGGSNGLSYRERYNNIKDTDSLVKKVYAAEKTLTNDSPQSGPKPTFGKSRSDFATSEEYDKAYDQYKKDFYSWAKGSATNVVSDLGQEHLDGTINGVKNYINAVISSDWFVQNFGDGGDLANPEIKASRQNSSDAGVYKLGFNTSGLVNTFQINSTYFKSEPTLLHEIAHYATALSETSPYEGHGVEFAQNNLRLVNQIMGSDDADKLHSSYIKEGVLSE